MLQWQRAAEARAGTDRDESTVMDRDIAIYHRRLTQTQTAMAQDLTGAARMCYENVKNTQWSEIHAGLGASNIQMWGAIRREAYVPITVKLYPLIVYCRRGPALGGPGKYRFYVICVLGPCMRLYNVPNDRAFTSSAGGVGNKQ